MRSSDRNMSDHAVELFAKAMSFYENGHTAKAIQTFTKIQDNLRAKINVCILYDLLGDPMKLKNALPSTTAVTAEDYREWYNLGFLFHKINEFDNAIYCLERCLSIQPDFIPALIKKGYCLEGTEPHRLEEAIECFESILCLGTEAVRREYGEIYHGLGHFLAECGRVDDGIGYMWKAIVEDVGYLPCYGTLHSEAKRYSQALDIFTSAFSEEGLEKIYRNALQKAEIRRRHNMVQEKKALQNEIIFYRGEAYCGLGDFQRATADFRTFAEYCKRSKNHDGIAHAQLYIAKAFLKQANLLLVTTQELRGHLESLNKHTFSLYANRYIHRDWEKTVKMIEAQLKLKELLMTPQLDDFDQVSGVASALLDACGETPLPVSLLSASVETPPFVHEAICLKPLLQSDGHTEERPEGDFPLLVVHVPKQLPTEFINVIYDRIEVSTIFLLSEASEMDLTAAIGKRGEDVLVFTDPGELCAAVLLVAAYERMKRDLLETVFLFGLTPTTEAPSFSAQTGVLPLLSF